MSTNRKRNMRVMHLWDWSEATKAVPYLHSVIGSLREHWLELRNAECQLERAAKVTATRQELMSQNSRRSDLERAQASFDDALDELHRIDAYLVDPVNGVACFPFRREDDLAWYIFDHFSPRGLIGWRYHTDPLEKCRPLDSGSESPLAV